MSLQWHLSKDGRQYGPYTDEQMKQFAREGRLGPADLVWNNELSDWSRADGIPGLLPTAAPAPKAPARQSPARSQDGETAHRPVAVKKRKGWKVLKTAVLLLVIAAVGIAVVSFFLDGAPSIRGSLEAAACRGVTEDSRPLERTDRFTQADKEIFLAVSGADSRKGSVLAADWWHRSEEGEILLAAYSLDLPGKDSRAHFSIVRPPFGWPTGEYYVILSQGNVPLLTVPFTVSE